MDIDASEGCHIQDLFGKDLAECHDHTDICLKTLQIFHTFRIPYLFRLKHGNPTAHGRFLHRRELHLLASSLRLIRLGHCQTDLMPRFRQRFQRPHGKIRSSHKYYFHLFVLLRSGIVKSVLCLVYI